MAEAALTLNTQVAFKLEAIEGTEEALTAAEVLLAKNPTAAVNAEAFDRGNVPGSLSSLGSIAGAPTTAFGFEMDLRGSGSVLTAPDWFGPAQACGLEQLTIVGVGIGAIAGGPFKHGESVSNGSGVSGVVDFDTADGASRLLIHGVSGGAFANLDVLTGAVSGATATANASEVAAGFGLKPKSTGNLSATIGGFEDPIRKIGRGCRGSMTLAFKNGAPGVNGLKFDFQGASSSTPVADAPNFAGVSYLSALPPIWFETGLSFDSYAPLVTEMNLNLANTLKNRGDAGAASKGILSTLITRRQWAGDMTYELVSVATFDTYGKWLAGTPESIGWTMNTVAGNIIRMYLPRLPFKDVTTEDDDGQRMIKAPFDLAGSLASIDDEIFIAAL